MNVQHKLNLASAGEKIAAHYLSEIGYTLVSCNYHSTYGEIDIIAKDKNELVIAEVKTRSSASEKNAENSISISKQKKLTSSAQQFLAEREDFAELSVRFDALIVIYRPKDETYKIKHIMNAFEPRYDEQYRS